MRRLLALLAAVLGSPHPAMAAGGFGLERNTNVVHEKSGLYVHREVELRVDATRLATHPQGSKGATSTLATSRFEPGLVSSTNFIPQAFERRGTHFVWTQRAHVSREDLKGQSRLGASVRWETPGQPDVQDTMELFSYPKPDQAQIDQWSEWMKAGERREGVFAWHSEVHSAPAESIRVPAYPFEMRFRLLLSPRMYP